MVEQHGLSRHAAVTELSAVLQAVLAHTLARSACTCTRWRGLSVPQAGGQRTRGGLALKPVALGLLSLSAFVHTATQ